MDTLLDCYSFDRNSQLHVDFLKAEKMKINTVVIIILCGLSLGTAHAASPKATQNAAKLEIDKRFSADRKICAVEPESSLRMQCLRDAKAEYDKAISALKQGTTTQPVSVPKSADTTEKNATACGDCGKVIAVRVVETAGESSPLGMIAGGVAGAILGHQIGQGRGKDLATIAGAAGGAYAGHKIEQNVRSTKQWIATVRFEDGSVRDFNFDKDPGLSEGVSVKNTQAGLMRR